MRQDFHLPSARRRVFWTVVAASGLVAALAAPGAALAAPGAAPQCSRGQFLWKSKNKCIDKAEAAKLGIYHGPIPQPDKPQENPTSAPDDSAADKPAPAQPAAEAAPPPTAAPEAPPQQPAAAPAPAAPSPYGDLPVGGFNKTN